MADSGIPILQSEAEVASDGAIPFLFELSWRTLTQVEPAAAVAQGKEEPPPPDRSGPSELDVVIPRSPGASAGRHSSGALKFEA